MKLYIHIASVALFFLLFTEVAYPKPHFVFDLEKSFSINSIKISSEGRSFYPSYYGGLAVIYNSEIFYPWSEGIRFVPLKLNKNQNVYNTEWIMYKEDVFYYYYQMDYEITSNEVKISAKDLGRVKNADTLPSGYADIYALYLDRCEEAIKPVIIGIPYLTTFNILYANNYFASIYFDWNKTNASQIIAYNNVFSDSSVYFSQYALYNPLTDSRRNKLNEIITMKVAVRIESVFPDIQNPVSKYKEESSTRVVFDDWTSFNNGITNVKKLEQEGIKNLWHIVHVWQRYGYDVALPDVFPANQEYGGNAELSKLSKYDASIGNLFSLHENYIDIFTQSEVFNGKILSLGTDSKYVFNWLQPYTKDTSYIVKPTEIMNIMGPRSREIKKTFNTTAAYHDVSSSYDPSKYVDYDFRVENAGCLREPYNEFKALADSLRAIHNGPVSGEGLAHYLYVGYYDDICAQIHTAQSLPGSYGTETLGGFFKPLFVDFNILKLNEKATVHGVGYYSRFFYDHSNSWGNTGFFRDSALMYAATELAYGNGAFISNGYYDMMEQAKIEFRYVYPVQLLYTSSSASKILYNDYGKLLNASDYIRKYPGSFNDFYSEDFMSQVLIIYENGLKVYVNRNPFKKWLIKKLPGKGYASFHAIVNGIDSLYSGNTDLKEAELPSSNGWFCSFSD